MLSPQPVGLLLNHSCSFNHNTKTGVQLNDVPKLDKINPSFTILFARTPNAMKIASLMKKMSDTPFQHPATW